MTVGDILQETYTALSANKARSGLTILGIVIGISSVISMVAIGQGAQSTIEERIQSIGSNLIMVMPGKACTLHFQKWGQKNFIRAARATRDIMTGKRRYCAKTPKGSLMPLWSAISEAIC